MTLGSTRHQRLGDSDLDWGQDLKGLKRWMDSNELNHIYLCYFGTADPTYLYYTLGKLQVLKLREDYRKAKGAAYSLQEFHDAFLSQGFPPVRIVRQALLLFRSVVRDAFVFGCRVGNSALGGSSASLSAKPFSCVRNSRSHSRMRS